MFAKTVERFHQKYTEADGCWEWRAFKQPNGYGTFRLPNNGRRMAYAHRVMYELVHGAIPEGYNIDHLCRNRSCVNPAHLEAVTPRENTLRGNGLTAQNARKTHCPKGHEYDEENTYWTAKGRYCMACKSPQPRPRKQKGTDAIPTQSKDSQEK